MDHALLCRFVKYLKAVKYWEAPDKGHWEETTGRGRLSSVGSCVAGLKAALALLVKADDTECAHSTREAIALGA